MVEKKWQGSIWETSLGKSKKNVTYATKKSGEIREQKLLRSSHEFETIVLRKTTKENWKEKGKTEKERWMKAHDLSIEFIYFNLVFQFDVT